MVFAPMQCQIIHAWHQENAHDSLNGYSYQACLRGANAAYSVCTFAFSSSFEVRAYLAEPSGSAFFLL